MRFPAQLMPSAGLLVAILSCWTPTLTNAEEPKTPTPEQIEFFQNKVKPILEQHCLRCHGGKGTPKGGLRLTGRANVLRGGESGPAVTLEKPAESLLVQAINYEGFEMPPSGKLPQEKIDVLTSWVRQGLPWPPGDEKPAESAVEHKPSSPQVNDETKKFWAFQPVRRPQVPQVADNNWNQNPLDAFVFSQLSAAGIQPNPAADKVALLRRAYYDLIGLPPEPEATAAFLADSSPDAFEKVIDRLLASAHYGERWGRHWLDLVRYAETNSYERDGAKPHVWRYRDYVIRAFNEDKPYDEFVREQLAGDELTPNTPDGIIATGYYRLGIWDDEPADPDQALYDDLDDIVQTTGQVFLGLTIGCARCHDHKLDPIPQKDYYKFLSFFRNVRRYGERSHESVMKASVRTIALEAERKEHEAAVEVHQNRMRRVLSDLKNIESKVKDDLVGVEKDEFKSESARIEIVGKRVPRLLTEEEFDRYKALTRERDQLRANRPPGAAQALCVTENGRTVEPTHVLVRGNPHILGERVEPGFLEVLSPPVPQIAELAAEVNSCGRRLALANWIASRDNQLTARVMVNRIWQYHFGRGLVRSASDFGFQGTLPTHPELLDWLAADFVENGWRLKRLHKLIMLSKTYQMSSRGNASAWDKDPENNLFWRYNMRRLSAEEVRDSILAVNGSLTREPYTGPSIFIKIPQEVLAGQSRPGEGWGESSVKDQNRRSVFIHSKRSLMPPILASFDAADTDNSCPVRFATTQPTQALGMLNSEFMGEQSMIFATNLARDAPQGLSQQVALALRRATQREPTESEIQRGIRLIDSMQSKHRLSPEVARQYFCLTVFNLNEFLYVD